MSCLNRSTYSLVLSPSDHLCSPSHLRFQQASFEALRVDSVPLWYLHGPDRSTPWAETFGATDKLFKEGKFERLGISNYKASEVEEILSLCDEKGWCKPTVYQGPYNAIQRQIEPELIPVMRKWGMSLIVSALNGRRDDLRPTSETRLTVLLSFFLLSCRPSTRKLLDLLLRLFFSLETKLHHPERTPNSLPLSFSLSASSVVSSPASRRPTPKPKLDLDSIPTEEWGSCTEDDTGRTSTSLLRPNLTR